MNKSAKNKRYVYNHTAIEKKWQKIWRKEKIYASSPKSQNNYYLLVELTYTSGDLHMGHWFAWCAPDAFARMKRMQGNNVLFPVGGFDAFGLPAENAAIKHGIHPRDWTYENIKKMRKQFEKMGPSFDWDKEVITSDRDYYRWTQWLFLKLFKKGLAYRGKVWSNWCPECKTVLANEHVQNGCCWRHTSTPVEQKLVDQWLFKITDYADRLIWPRNPKVDWPQAALEGQNNWIGRKEGINISYEIEGLEEKITVWTSRPDTNFGATFVVLAPEHEFVSKILRGEIKCSEKTRKDIQDYVNTSKRKLERERLVETKDKSGVFTGFYAINRLNNEKLPIWISDFVLSSVGTGAIVGVPGHDKRDFEFATKFGLPVKRVVVGPDGDRDEIKKPQQVLEEGGTMINSGFLNGMDSHKAVQKMMDYLEKKGWGKRAVNYHLRDWSVSRRRYWGAPVPIIYCRYCWHNRRKSEKDKGQSLKEGVDFATLDDGKKYVIHPVPESDLPVTLPEKVDYMPTGKAPLATAKDWIKVKCPVCGSEAKRDVETLDTYVDSSWYFFRYPSPKYDKGPFDPKIIKKWMPIKVYFGGPEHILGHTLYARFITKFLYDQGLINFEEFALKRFHHGVILGPDGFRMSKSRGNVVNPDEQVKKFGADAVRLYINFLGPHEKGGAWKTEGIEGSYRYLTRVWRLITNYKDLAIVDEEDARRIFSMQHRTIKKVTEDIEILHTHTAIAALMEFTNLLDEVAKKSQLSIPGSQPSGNSQSDVSQPVLREEKRKKGKLETDDQELKEEKRIRCAEWDSALRTLLLLLAPFAPHMTEELYQQYYAGNSEFGARNSKQITNRKFSSIHLKTWPKFEAELIKEEVVSIVVQVNGKLRATLEIEAENSKLEEKVIEAARQNENVAKWLEDKRVVKEVFVPGKLINFVIKN